MGKTKKEGYFEVVFKGFWKTLRHADSRIIIIAAYELLFYAGFLFVSRWIIKTAASGAQTFAGMDLQSMAYNPELVSQGMDVVKNIQVSVLRAVIFGVMGLLIGWTLFKGLAWSKVYRRKLKKLFFAQFFVLSASIIIIFSLSAYIILKKLIPEMKPLLLVVTLLLVHFGWISYASLARESSLKKALKDAFFVGAARIHRLAIPYLLLAALLFISLTIGGLMVFLPTMTRGVVVAVIIFFYLAFTKLYLGRMFDHIHTPEK